jgi:hypothetical protein
VIVLTSIGTLIGILVLFVKPGLGLALLATTAIYGFREIREAKQKYFSGNVCPGLVLSARHNLVAVYTDLATSESLAFPAILILKQPLSRLATGPARDGMRVATAALYLGSVKESAWKGFWPEVIDCVERDPDEITRVLGSISEEEWQMLDLLLAQVPEAKEGLHRIRNIPGINGSPNGWPDESTLAPPRPWFKSPAALFGFAAIILVTGVTLRTGVVGSAAKRTPPEPRFQRPATVAPFSPPAGMPVARPAATAPQPPPIPAPGFPRTGPLTQTGPYAIGGMVEAHWVGGWLRGKITSINPGGYSVMVQLEDTRFPHPIVFSTNLIRLP